MFKRRGAIDDLIERLRKQGEVFLFWASICLLASSPLTHVRAQCIEPPTGLVSWWSGEGNAKDVLDQNHGALVNGAGFSKGKVGQAFRLLGPKDYVLVGDSLDLNITGDLTLDGWLNLPGGNEGQESFSRADRTIIDKRNDTNTLVTYSLYIEGDLPSAPPATAPLRFLVKSPAKSVASSRNLKWQPDRWYHVATVKSDQTTTFYRDGLTVGEQILAVPSVRTTGSFLAIGASPISRGVSFPIQGLLDEIEIFNRALSAIEIKAIFNAGRAGKCRETFSQNEGEPFSGTPPSID